jgi:hypothetical protein
MRYVVAALALVAILGSAGFNKFGDDDAVRAQAELTACGFMLCSRAAGHPRVTRTVSEETFEYTFPQRSEPPTGEVAVRCAREGVLFGPYVCTKE